MTPDEETGRRFALFLELDRLCTAHTDSLPPAEGTVIVVAALADTLACQLVEGMYKVGGKVPTVDAAVELWQRSTGDGDIRIAFERAVQSCHDVIAEQGAPPPWDKT